MRYLLFTVDYEIFGNGSGDVKLHMVEPAARIATIADRYNVPVTFFLEIEEYLAFERYDKELSADLGYSPATLIREQVRTLSERGHDFQLHIHPQWYGARYERKRWVFSQLKPSVDEMFDHQQEVNEYVALRKQEIETIVGPGGKKVCAYRAGAFCMQPARMMLAALAQNGISVDSSVVRGLNNHTSYGNIDYRRTPEKSRLWRLSDDVCVYDPNGTIFEAPIFSTPGRRIFQLSPERLRAKFSRSIPRENQSELMHDLGISANPFTLLKFLLSPAPIKLDFHNLSVAALLNRIRKAPSTEGTDPVDIMVLIGHSKEHLTDTVIDGVLRAIRSMDRIKVISFSELAGMLENH